MKEEDLKKAIELKDKPDSERQLLRSVHFPPVYSRVNLEGNIDHGRIRNIDYLPDNDVIKGLRAMVIANIEKRIDYLLEESEKF